MYYKEQLIEGSFKLVNKYRTYNCNPYLKKAFIVEPSKKLINNLVSKLFHKIILFNRGFLIEDFLKPLRLVGVFVMHKSTSIRQCLPVLDSVYQY